MSIITSITTVIAQYKVWAIAGAVACVSVVTTVVVMKSSEETPAQAPIQQAEL